MKPPASLKPFVDRRLSISELVVRWCLGLLVLLVPLWSWPTLSSPSEWGKLWLIGLLVAVALIGMAITVLRQPSRAIHWARRDAWLFAVVLILGLSWLFSIDRDAGTFGVPGSAHHSLVFCLSLVIVVVLTNWTWPTTSDKRPLRQLFLIGLGAATVWVAWQLLYAATGNGLTGALPNTLVASNDLLGVVMALSAAVAVVTVLAVRGHRLRLICGLWLILALGSLAALNRPDAWIVLLIATTALLLYQLRQSSKVSRWWWAMTVAVFALAMSGSLGVDYSFGQSQLAGDLSLDRPTGWSVVKQSLLDRPLFGAGPETFGSVFTSERPVRYNQTDQWNLRFVRSTSELTHLLSTVGILGTVAFLGPLLVGMFLIIRSVFGRRERSAGRDLVLVIVLPLLILGAWRTWSVIMVWLMVVALLLIDEPRAEPSRFRLKAHRAMHPTVTAIVGLVLALGGLVMIGRAAAADHLVGRSQQLLENDLAAAEQSLRQAWQLDASHPAADALLASALLQRASAELTAGQPVETVQRSVDEALLLLRDAMTKAPLDVTAVERLIDGYRAVASLSPGTENVIPDLYARARQLDPANPSVAAEAGQYFLTLPVPAADDTETTNWPDRARQQFAEALDLKPDYAIARLGLAQSLEALGRLEDAQASYDQLLVETNGALDAHYAVGDWYLRQNKLEEAAAQYAQVLAQEPRHANAHYQLSVVYEKQGKIAEAMAEIEEVMKDNPENAELVQRLAELQAQQP